MKRRDQSVFKRCMKRKWEERVREEEHKRG